MLRRTVWVALALLLAAPFAFAQAQSPPPSQEKRIALVIGNAAYQKGALQTPANDAGLIAQTLQAAGFDVVGARDLDGETLRGSLRDFVQKAQASGPNTVAFVYLAGYGVQLTGENYFVPVDANINRDTDVPVEALRVSDYMRQLAALPLKANIFVLDAARENPFAKEGDPLAGGLALMEPPKNTLIAFNAAPGTVGGNDQGPYGPYAQALAEMIRSGGLTLPHLFDQARLRVSETTKGGQIPWNVQNVDTSFVFFERQSDAPPQPDQAALQSKPVRDFSNAQEAYMAALERDTMQGYEDFIAAYPDDPLAKRARAILASRREAITWRRTVNFNTPEAYWSYIRRYPRGPHVADAHRRLAILSAALEPPPSFDVVAYDVPPPPPDEIVYVDRPVVYYADPYYDFAPPPEPPVYFLPPPPPDFIVLEPPPPPFGIFILPVPVFVPIPVFVRPPSYIAPPRNNIIFANIHNAGVVNNFINRPNGAVDRGPQGRGQPPLPQATPSLPPAATQRANLIREGRAPNPSGPNISAPNTGGPNAVTPNAAGGPNGRPDFNRSGLNGPANGPANSHLLPGANGQPLPNARTLPNVANAPSGNRSAGDRFDRRNGVNPQNGARVGSQAGNPPGNPSSGPSRFDRRGNANAPSGARPSPSSAPSSRTFAARPPSEYRRPGPPPPAMRHIERPVNRPSPPPQYARPSFQRSAPPPQIARPQPQFTRPSPPPQQFARPSPPPQMARPAPPPPPPVARAAPPPPPRPAPPPPAARAAPAGKPAACGNPKGCPPPH